MLLHQLDVCVTVTLHDFSWLPHRYTAACLHQRRTADLAAAWQRQQTAFLADSGRMLAEAAAAAAAGAEAAAARLAWEAAGGLLAGQLAELQLAKQQEQQVMAEVAAYCCFMNSWQIATQLLVTCQLMF